MNKMYCTHKGTFSGRGPRTGFPVDWMVELWRPMEDGTGPSVPRDLVFPHEQPLLIEWYEWTPETALQGAMATLTVVSMTDREFIDYYTTQAGTIYMKVYRRAWNDEDWRLCWRGSLDPEFYEEPYERTTGYDVKLSFSDFGALKRLDFARFPFMGVWPKSDKVSLLALLTQAFWLAGLIDRDDYWISNELYIMSAAKIYDTTGKEWPLNNQFADLYCECSNFEDEEGKPKNWHQVIESVLLPLGLHVTQRGGKIQIYDTDFLAGNADESDFVHWTDVSQTLGTGKTYNRIKLTFSPYCRAESCIPEVEPDMNAGHVVSRVWPNARVESWATGLSAWEVYKSFRMIRTSKGSGPVYVYGEDPYFKIEPIYGSAQDCTGLIFPAQPKYVGTFSDEQSVYNAPTLFRLPPVLIPGKSAESSWLLFSMSMLFDPRYNPFENADPGVDGLTNNKKQWDALQKMRWVSVPMRIVLKSPDGRVMAYFSNSYTFEYNHKPVEWMSYAGSWRSVQQGDTIGVCWAQWYGDKKDDCAVNGWSQNRPTLGIMTAVDDLPAYFTHTPDGMIVPYPETGGYIEISVLDGVLVHHADYVFGPGLSLSAYNTWLTDANGNPYPASEMVKSKDVDEVVSKCKWRAFKDFRLSIVDSSTAWKAESADDEVIETAVDVNAADELKIDTICGTSVDPCSAMRGLYKTADGTAVYAMKRGSIKNRVERMLVGTLYSQYARRRFTLRGEAAENSMGLPVWRDHNTTGLFIISSSELDAKAGTESLTLTQFFADSFEAEPLVENVVNRFDDERPDEIQDVYDQELSDPWTEDRETPEDPDPGYGPDDPWDDPGDYYEDDDRYDDRDYEAHYV